MSSSRGIHWRLVLIAGFLSELAVFVIYLVLLAATAFLPGLTRAADEPAFELVASFMMVLVFTLWVGRRISSGFVVHGMMTGLVAILLFVASIVAFDPTLTQTPLYVMGTIIAQAIGGIAGGLAAHRRNAARAPLPT
jgi:hypothetical protein